jgi:hypothetical protein
LRYSGKLPFFKKLLSSPLIGWNQDADLKLTNQMAYEDLTPKSATSQDHHIHYFSISFFLIMVSGLETRLLSDTESKAWIQPPCSARK